MEPEKTTLITRGDRSMAVTGPKGTRELGAKALVSGGTANFGIKAAKRAMRGKGLREYKDAMWDRQRKAAERKLKGAA